MLVKRLIFATFALICITACLSWASSPAQSATDLTDISGNTANPQISYLVNKGAMSGYDDGTFRPVQNITRAEFITIMNRAYGFDQEALISYRDVKPGDWYYREIARAVAAGYIPFSAEGEFGPNNLVKREEAAFMMAAALNLDTSKTRDSLSFKDSSSISSPMMAAVVAMTRLGFINGYEDVTFRPLNYISRAESAVIITKGLKLNIPAAVGSYSVKDYGAKGDGIHNDTTAIQNAIDAADSRGGGTVAIPDGIYLIDPEVGIVLKNNLKLYLADNAILKAQATRSETYALISIVDVSNVQLAGGQIIGERNEHLAMTGEWGHGIRILGSNNVYVADIAVLDCWGDGIYIGSTSTQNYSANVTIDRFFIDNCRRNGISLISGKDVTIKNGTISNTQGTEPQCGIDIEPNSTREFLQKILIENVTASNNGNYGLKFSFARNMTTTNEVTVTLKKLININNHEGAYNNWETYKPRNRLFHVTLI